jgi:hypothetical protein
MKHPNIDYNRTLTSVRSGKFCDSGHYLCPEVLGNGNIRFPSGGVVRPDNSFAGPALLLDTIRRVLSYAGYSAGCGDAPESCPARTYWDAGHPHPGLAA